uniref:Dihydropteroate synthase n=1 Tax=Chlorobium chlorochromatii (strain CaD3) TaxID=340177 RepID=Q3ATI2_CHLCH
MVMGILNTTPDSFYDGGNFVQSGKAIDVECALERALCMVREGAAIIDVGGESSRPGAVKISAEEEIKRTVPLIAKLRQASDVLISIDTYKAEVAKAALQAGANIVNDISGFTFDAALPEVCRRYNAGVVLMQTPVTPQEMQWSLLTPNSNGNVVAQVRQSLEKSLAVAKRHGITNIMLDPGFGFGKSVEENYRLLAHLSLLQNLGYPLLVGLSRKSFLGRLKVNGEMLIFPAKERFVATIAAQALALQQGARIIRAHDVAEAVQCLQIVEATQAAGAVDYPHDSGFPHSRE